MTNFINRILLRQYITVKAFKLSSSLVIVLLSFQTYIAPSLSIDNPNHIRLNSVSEKENINYLWSNLLPMMLDVKSTMNKTVANEIKLMATRPNKIFDLVHFIRFRLMMADIFLSRIEINPFLPNKYGSNMLTRQLSTTSDARRLKISNSGSPFAAFLRAIYRSEKLKN